MEGRFKPENVHATIKPAGWFKSSTGADIVDMSDTGIGLRTRTLFAHGAKVKILIVNGAPDHRMTLTGVVRVALAEPGGWHRIDVGFGDLEHKERQKIRALRPA